jgi:hypothetical protein
LNFAFFYLYLHFLCRETSVSPIEPQLNPNWTPIDPPFCFLLLGWVCRPKSMIRPHPLLKHR